MTRSTTPAQQARKDKEKSSAMPVKQWKDMTDEEKAAFRERISSNPLHERAKQRALEVRKGIRR